jgi:UPF0042 nucleotide-binding protein
LKGTNLKIFIITGLSGSGKSTALDVFEDAGFYCVDNLPVVLLPKFLELLIDSRSEIAGLAFVMDIREKQFLSNYQTAFETLKNTGYRFEIIFLEADETVLLQRYSMTRRQHPLSPEKNLLESIRAEKEQLKSLKAAAGEIINTSRFNVHELKAAISETLQKSESRAIVNILVQSFGFKYGIPLDSDLLIDVRFLSNPYFIPKLKLLDGESEAIKAYVLNRGTTQQFLKKYLELLDYLIPLYEKDGRAYLTIAVGCTGGRHRSVTIAREIFEHVEKKGKHVKIAHRDIDR